MLDALTGLTSHRDLDTSVADGEPFALLVDVDSLIWLNAEFGHEVGDQALVGIATELARAFETNALSRIFRVGGDAFLVVLPSASNDPLLAATRVVDLVRALNIPYRHSRHPERTRLEVNVAVVRLTAQRISQCFEETGITRTCSEFFSELVYREKQRHGGRPGVVVDACNEAWGV